MNKKQRKLDYMRQYSQRDGGGITNNLRGMGGCNRKSLMFEQYAPQVGTPAPQKRAQIYAGSLTAVFSRIFIAYISISLIINLKERDIREYISKNLSAGRGRISAGWYISVSFFPQVGFFVIANLRKVFSMISMTYVIKGGAPQVRKCYAPPSLFCLVET